MVGFKNFVQLVLIYQELGSLADIDLQHFMIMVDEQTDAKEGFRNEKVYDWVTFMT